MNISIILSGGVGVRFGNELPKQYNMLLGKEVIYYTVKALKESLLTDGIIIVAGKESLKRLSAEYGVECIEGGPSRNRSLKNGLDFIKEKYPLCKNVFINEAVRPFLTAALVDDYYRYLCGYDAVITAQYITDSLGREGEPVTNRSEYYLIQAPEAFRFDLLYKCFSAESPITATVQQLPENRNVKKCFEYKHNIKITYYEDLLYAQQLMKLYC